MFVNELNLIHLLQNKEYCENNIKLVNQLLDSTVLNNFNITENLELRSKNLELNTQSKNKNIYSQTCHASDYLNDTNTSHFE